jgi:hypothetical protein
MLSYILTLSLLTRPYEYDEDITEYWINTRTKGKLTQQELESLKHEQLGEGQVPEDWAGVVPQLSLNNWNLENESGLLGNGLTVEGDDNKKATKFNDNTWSQPE